jgi:hypothetical protein
MKAEKSACPLAAEGDSPIFAAKRGSSKKHVLAAAKIGTVPCERLRATNGSPVFADIHPSGCVSFLEIKTAGINKITNIMIGAMYRAMDKTIKVISQLANTRAIASTTNSL